MRTSRRDAARLRQKCQDTAETETIWQTCQDTAESATIFNDATKNTFEKTEALEKHVMTVTMRAESLATTEADFFDALLSRHEETQKHLDELAAQLSQQNIATRST